MAEIIGIVASILTLAGAGAKLADTLRNVSNTIISAENEASLIAADISVFSSSLTQLSKLIGDRLSPESLKLYEIVSVLIPACKALIEELDKLVGDPMDFRMKHPLWIKLLKIKFRWLIQGPKVAFVKSLIESFKLTMVFLVSTMDLAEAIHRDAPDTIRKSLKIQVESNIGFAEDAKAKLLKFQNPPHASEESLGMLTDSDAVSFQTTSTLVPTSIVSDGDIGLSQAVVTYNPNSEKTDEDDLYETSLYSTDSECAAVSLSQCSKELVRIIEVQEMTAALAKDILSIAPQPAWNWSWDSTRQSLSDESNFEEKKVWKEEPDSGENASGTRSAQHNAFAEVPLPTVTREFSKMEEKNSRSPVVSGTTMYNDSSATQDIDPMQFLDTQPVDRLTDIEAIIRKVLGEALPALNMRAAPTTAASSTIPDPLPNDRTYRPPTQERSSSDQDSRDWWQRTDDGMEKLTKLERFMLEERDKSIREQAALEIERKSQSISAQKRADEDKLAKLEMLILAQKDEQLKREAALEAQRAAQQAAAQEAAAKIAKEKKAAAEAASLLLEAAKKAREEAEAKAAKEARELKEGHEKALAEAKQAAEELERAKRSAEEEVAKLKPSDAPQLPIRFKDAVGRKFSFPWHICKTWKGFEALVKQAFLHVDVIGPHVNEGHYDLVGPDGEIILPQVWEKMVQPDWQISMHMWPMPEPPPPPPPPGLLPQPSPGKRGDGLKASKLRDSLGKLFERSSERT